ncbi:hypothetical protein L3Q67_32955 [Saccharothrix sp. AJ9571]|nr:hypothetical protein L3Q67_32955 [Saccharothrix sp. AJ9571]
MDADLMLRWMSETGAGGIRSLRDHLTWLARTSDTDATAAASGRWVRELLALGHAEVWWEQDRWATTPSVIARLPVADGTAVVTGARPTGIAEKLQASEVAFHVHHTEPADGDLPMPASWLIQFDDVAVLREVAANVGARYAGCAAIRLAAHLPVASLGRPSPPPARVTDLERLNPSGRFVRVTDKSELDGLYRLRANGRVVHLYRHRGEWLHTDRATGTFIDLARRGTRVLRWRSEGREGRTHIGTLFVDQHAMPLPALQARALTLCSGRAPDVSHSAQTSSYSNVPLAIANQVAESLHQVIEQIP